VSLARRQLNRRRQVEVRLAQLTHLTGELEQQVAQVRALAMAVERTRLAREIHDDLGHRLVLVNVQLQLVEELIENEPDAALSQLCCTREQLREAWTSVLGAADAVLSIDGATLALALDRLVADCRELTSMRIELRIIGDPTTIDAAVACALYRAVQEGLTNTCKYAEAEHSHVLVYCDDAVAQVSVRDDGCSGVTPPAAQRTSDGGGHFGLAGLRERAESLSGSLEAGPLPEGGFLLRMIIPLP
jgi:signal transduction histidine kinase